MITEGDRRIQEAHRLAEGASLRLRGLERGWLLSYRQPCWSCLWPVDDGLERQQPDQRGWPQPCKECGQMPLTKRERQLCLRAREQYDRQADAGRTNLVQTPSAQYRASSWECQHGRRWYTSPAAGRPVMQPARELGHGEDWTAHDCGLGRKCGAEHDRRLDADVDSTAVESQAVGHTSVAVPLWWPASSAYPMGEPSHVLPGS